MEQQAFKVDPNEKSTDLPKEIVALNINTRSSQVACLKIEQFDREVGGKAMVFVGLPIETMIAIRHNGSETGRPNVMSDGESEVLNTRSPGVSPFLFADDAAHRTWCAPNVAFMAVLVDRAEAAAKNYAANLKKWHGIDVPVRVVEV